MARIDRSGVIGFVRDHDTSEILPLSMSEVIQFALREVAQARQHLDSAEDRLQLLLTWTEDTRPPGPDQFH